MAEMFNSHKLCQKVIWKKSHFALDNKISDTAKAIDLIFQSYLDHSSNNRINNIYKNQISVIFVGQMQKKYLNLSMHFTQKNCWF